MWIFCCGMYRSGSTLQYQIAVDLVTRRGLGSGLGYLLPEKFRAMAARPGEENEFKVIKTHAFIPEAEQLLRSGKAKALYSYRDIRDVIASLMTMQNSSFAKLRDEGVCYTILKAYEDWSRFGDIHISRYEDMVADVPGEVSRIARYLEITISEEEKAAIATEYSLERQKERIRQIKPDQMGEKLNGNTIDPKTQLHHNHINSGAQGKWRESLSNREVALVEHIARDWMKERGYSFSQNWLMRKSSGVSFYLRQTVKDLLGRRVGS